MVTFHQPGYQCTCKKFLALCAFLMFAFLPKYVTQVTSSIFVHYQRQPSALGLSIHVGSKAYTLYEFILILGSIVLWAKDFKWNNENLLKRTC